MPPADTPLDLRHLQTWVGRETVADDLLAAGHARLMAATLGLPQEPLQAGSALPPLWHWIYFLQALPPAELGRDGHPARGGFLPPVPLPNRMWAGGRLDFLAPLKLGHLAQKRSCIESIEHKRGRSGDLVFVTVRHEVHQHGTLALREWHDIVYKAATPNAPGTIAPPAPGGPAAQNALAHTAAAQPHAHAPGSTALTTLTTPAPPATTAVPASPAALFPPTAPASSGAQAAPASAAPAHTAAAQPQAHAPGKSASAAHTAPPLAATPADLPTPAARRAWRPDATQLFRYSALTFNGHRIHYDADYCRQVEGYANLVVHGPLNATLLAAWAQQQASGAALAHFAYRALRPALLGQALHLDAAAHQPGHPLAVWLTLDNGEVSMRAQAVFA